MNNDKLLGQEELPMLCEDSRIVPIDKLESWQVDQLMNTIDTQSLHQANLNLEAIDQIPNEWIKKLTVDDWNKIDRQQSLYGIKLPDKWVKVWRIILKEKNLRNAERATHNGFSIGSYSHLWNLWAEDCIDKFLSEMEKELLRLVDYGYLYSEIGEIMLAKYGNEFWKQRKTDTKTTPSQVVNNYLYWRMPNHIARSELTEMVLITLNKMKKLHK